MSYSLFSSVGFSLRRRTNARASPILGAHREIVLLLFAPNVKSTPTTFPHLASHRF
jgi:hypothetical protein